MKKQRVNFTYVMIISIVAILCTVGIVLFMGLGTSIDAISSGYTLSGGAPEDFAGYVALKVDQSSYDVNDVVPFEFNYGQLYDENDGTTILNHSVTVYVANWFKTYPDEIPMDYFQQRKIDFDERDFLEPSNQILNESPLLMGDEILFQQGFSLDIDFNNIPLTRGVIVIELARIIIFEDDNGNYEGKEIKQALLYFEKDGDQIKFASRPII